MTDKLRDEFADLRADALREGLISSMVDVEVLWACFVLCRQAPAPCTVRAALEYTNVLLEKLPASEEITYRLNANKAVLNETKN